MLHAKMQLILFNALFLSELDFRGFESLKKGLILDQKRDRAIFDLLSIKGIINLNCN